MLADVPPFSAAGFVGVPDPLVAPPVVPSFLAPSAADKSSSSLDVSLDLSAPVLSVPVLPSGPVATSNF